MPSAKPHKGSLPEPFPYRRLTSERVGRYGVEVGELDTPQGPSQYSILHMKPFSCVLAITSARGDADGRIALVRQWRYSVGSWQLELPAGGIEPGETAEDAARRELREETGLVAEKVLSLGSVYTTVGSADECAHLFVARCFERRDPLPQDRGEQVEVVEVSRSEFERMLAEGTCVYPPAYVIWLRLQMRGLLDSWL
ncbi:MAG: NUDIX hydrolase [Olsenella sp.]|nr:NUDIX hydrolase [Olsenella sp.]